MGEYANYGGQYIKIGTCEDMYYLRAQDAHKMGPADGSLDPKDPDVQKVIRFRFPWPEEDYQSPGEYEPFRSEGLHIPVPDDVTHGHRQFATEGYNVCLPCPESKEGKNFPFKIHMNGNLGAVRFSQQAWRGGVLALVAECGGCGNKFSYMTLEEVMPVLDGLEKHVEFEERRKPHSPAAQRYREIIKRIRDGYRSRQAQAIA